MAQSGSIKGTPHNMAKAFVSAFPGCQGELVEILEKLDAGYLVDTAGIPDHLSQARDMLHALLLSSTLRLKRTPTQGLFFRPPPASEGGEGTLVLQLARMLEGGAEAREGGRPGEAAAAAAAAAAEAAGPQGAQSSAEGCRRPEPIGPSPRPPAPAAAAAADEAATSFPEEPPPDKGRRVVIGPSLPTVAEQEQAAVAAERGGGMDQQAGEEGEKEEGDFVGPMPSAEMLLDPDNATQAQRYQEVSRVLEALVDVRPPRIHFAVLGLPFSATASEVGARFRRLSLMLHPDKCMHPRASDAFDAAKAAARELQDPAKRAAVDARLEEEKEKEAAMAEYERERQAAQWRRLRNEAPLPEDEEILKGPVAAPTRDEWMTELPPERQASASAAVAQTSVTAFSRVERTGRGDTSAWTDTPAQRAERARQEAEQKRLSAQGDGDAFPSSSSLAVSRGQRVPMPERGLASSWVTTPQQRQEAALVEQLSASRKGTKSLVEKHQENMIKAAKAKEKKRKRVEDAGGRDDPSFPVEYRPWDRERDLVAGPGRPSSMHHLAQQAQHLASRFSRGTGPSK